jgi:hypothetical protein
MPRVVVVTTRRHLGAQRLGELERIFGPVDLEVVDSFRLGAIVSVVSGASAVVLDAVSPSIREELLPAILGMPILRPIRREVKDRQGGLGARFVGYGLLQSDGSIRTLTERELAS